MSLIGVPVAVWDCDFGFQKQSLVYGIVLCWESFGNQNNNSPRWTAASECALDRNVIERGTWVQILQILLPGYYLSMGTK